MFSCRLPTNIHGLSTMESCCPLLFLAAADGSSSATSANSVTSPGSTRTTPRARGAASPRSQQQQAAMDRLSTPKSLVLPAPAVATASASASVTTSTVPSAASGASHVCLLTLQTACP